MSGTELMNTASTPQIQLQRRSPAYKAWIIQKLGELAFVIGQSSALDKKGIRQAEMANDLCDTRPDAMEETFLRLRRRCAFFPATKEILDVYEQELSEILDDEASEKRAKEDSKQQALAADRKAHPENYFSVAEIVKERGGPEAIIGESRERLRERLNRNKVMLPDPDVRECPHCGKGIPFAVRDLNALSAADLRSMADRKAEKEAAVAMAGAKLQQQLGDEALRAQQAANHRRRRDDQPQPSTTEA